MTDQPIKKTTTKDRSVAYPSITLSDAIDYARKLRDGLGKGPYSREEAAKALGHAKLTGPSARKVAALAQYGFLERNGNTYSQTVLAQNILLPLSDEQKEFSIRRAAINPRLFAKLCKKFGGQALPSLLENIIVHEGVSEGAASEVVRLFTDSMKFSGILINGVIAQIDTGEFLESDVEVAASVPTPVVSSPIYKTKTETQVDKGDHFIFEFAGEIRLTIPRTSITSEAIVEGELKKIKAGINDFAKKFCQKSGDSNATDAGDEKL